MQEPTEPMSLEEIDLHVGDDSWRDHWPTERIPRSGRRRRINMDTVLALAFSVLGGLAAGAVVWFTWQGGRQSPAPPVPAVSQSPAPSPSWLTLPSHPVPSSVPPPVQRPSSAAADHTTPARPSPSRSKTHRPKPSTSDSVPAKGSPDPPAVVSSSPAPDTPASQSESGAL